MTLTMGDGPVANLPAGLNAYGGYVNDSGIGETYPEVVTLAAAQKAVAFSITTNGSPAQAADVEKGAMEDWSGYTWGYCSVSRVNDLIAKYGRPKKLWTAHQDPAIGSHICSPACWPGLVTTADGTQWIDHGGWDESLLADDFFQTAPVPTPPPTEASMGIVAEPSTGQDNVFQVSGNALWHKWRLAGQTNWHNENVGVVAGPSAGAQFPNQVPSVSVNGADIKVTVEDAGGKGWFFEQNAGPWGVNELP